MTPVLVHWIDSSGQDAWGRYQQCESLKCATIGHLYEEQDDRIVVALNRAENCHGCYITIPRLAVLSVVRLIPARASIKPKRKVRSTRRGRATRQTVWLAQKPPTGN
jgi:hypothetical protein